MVHIANRQLGRSQRCVRLAATRVCSGETRPQACGSGPRWFEGISAYRAVAFDPDLAAFAALDQLAARGIATTRIAVRSDEAPAELLEAADMISTPLRAPPSCCRRCCSRREGAMRAPPHCGNLFAAPWPLAGGERDMRQNGHRAGKNAAEVTRDDQPGESAPYR